MLGVALCSTPLYAYPWRKRTCFHYTTIFQGLQDVLQKLRSIVIKTNVKLFYLVSLLPQEHASRLFYATGTFCASINNVF
jgi:hypothetical protein